QQMPPRQPRTQVDKLRIDKRLAAGDVDQPGLAGGVKRLFPLCVGRMNHQLRRQRCGRKEAVAATEVAGGQEYKIGFNVVMHSARLNGGGILPWEMRGA